jgi:hypothetical protein
MNLRPLFLTLTLAIPDGAYAQYPYPREPRYPAPAYQRHAPYYHRDWYAPQFRSYRRVFPRNDRSPYYNHCYSVQYGNQCRGD